MNLREEDDYLNPKLRANFDLILTPTEGSDIKSILQALENIDNYGKYVSNIRTDKVSLQKALEDYFGPSLPVKRKSLEKQRGSSFPVKTKQAVDDFIKKFTSDPSLLFYVPQKNSIIFPKEKNPNKEFTKKVVQTVLGNAGLSYDLREKETQNENLKNMKKSEVKKIILEVINDIQVQETEPQYEVYDDVGKVYQVKRPKMGLTKEDMVCEVTVFDEIKKDETHGIYKNRSEANRTATQLLKDFETQLNELEKEMEAYRSTKKEASEKAKIAKEKISQLKGETSVSKK